MLLFQIFIWSWMIILRDGVTALPAAVSLTKHNIDSAGLGTTIDHINRRENIIQHLSNILERTPPKKDTGSGRNSPTQDSPKQDKGKGKADPQTPASPKGKGKIDTIYKLGECGKEVEGTLIKNVDKSGNTPARKIKTPKQPTTPKPPKSYDDGEDGDGLDKAPLDRASGTKKMQMCKNKVDLPFPTYPSSGDVIEKVDKWKGLLNAYNVALEDPCDNDYDFKKLPFPSTKVDGVYTPIKDSKNRKEYSKDIWQTEHVMDAQILKRFFQEQFEGVDKPKVEKAKIDRSEIPKEWISSIKGKAAKQDQCDYLEQFWNKRWGGIGNPDPRGNAMKYLLSEFPGETKYLKEMLLLPGRLNNKKSQLFGIKGHNVIALRKFTSMPLHQKIDELREVVLLIAYLNEPEFRKHWKAVALRLRDRLEEIEASGSNGYMRKTDDYWFKQKADSTLKDGTNERYEPVGLAKKWVLFINNFVDDRTTRMQSLLVKLHWELETEWQDAKTYVDLPKDEGSKLGTRMAVLAKHIQDKVDIKKLRIDSTSTPSTPVPGTPDISDDEDSSDGVPDDTPSKPPTFVVPIRPKPTPTPI
ncbi:hypothetical protein C7974DRAFT_474255 [Boeremia exigua]|uniref:uncharacterized protein n=1 Tax=Boeremia exigua TaxID=749465 RepID=UPI001E8CEF82|nr:uncharacterized protein C7974DRAFT_474255 [Boeremia exigua]KAH6620568.1 hypothetical protein C7974DRAFT_474255 [Boeremia exigua]